jgi:hypothetical protein
VTPAPDSRRSSAQSRLNLYDPADTVTYRRGDIAALAPYRRGLADHVTDLGDYTRDLPVPPAV